MRANYPQDFRPRPAPVMRHPRRDFLLLAGLNDGQLNAAVARSQMPYLPSDRAEDPHDIIIMYGAPLPPTAEQRVGWDARGWATDIAFAWIAQRALVEQHQVSVARANEIVRSAFHIEDPYWPQIREQAEQQLKNQPPFGPDIMLASITLRDGKQGVGIGKLAELAAKIPDDATSIIAISLTAAAVKLRQRAREHDIDITGWWLRDQELP